MKIYGSGMSGLLAAHALRRYNPVIYERQASLPNNHNALLRFRSSVCSELTGIPFRRVNIVKGVVWQGQLHNAATLAMNNAYSAKVVGRVTERSVLNLQGGERWVAPPDFIARMAGGVKIEYNKELGAGMLTRNGSSEPIVSTIPMPTIMGIVGQDNPPKFAWRKVWTAVSELEDCDVFQTLYYPGAERYYRASITGATLMVEYVIDPVGGQDEDVKSVLKDFGINQSPEVKLKSQEYGKLTPLADPGQAKSFILMLTDRYRIYSLGRFATWRQILLDDVAHDAEVIGRLLDCRDRYQLALKGAR